MRKAPYAFWPNLLNCIHFSFLINAEAQDSPSLSPAQVGAPIYSDKTLSTLRHPPASPTGAGQTMKVSPNLPPNKQQARLVQCRLSHNVVKLLDPKSFEFVLFKLYLEVGPESLGRVLMRQMHRRDSRLW